MSPKYKLTYFNAIGVGEPIRYILSYGKLEFEDVRVEHADWPKLKPSVNFGKLPIFEIDGKTINQSLAISRYLAKKVGLIGKTEEDQLQADAVVETLADFRQNYSVMHRAPEDQKAAKLKDIKETQNPFYLSRLEKIVAENGGTFVKDQQTWADFYFAAISDRLINVCKEDILAPYPGLKALAEKVNNLPGIKEYRAKRPNTSL